MRGQQDPQSHMFTYISVFRWFLDMNMDEPGFDASTFSKNRDRLLGQDVATKFFDAVVRLASQKGLLSQEHFTVDGTLIEAWASHKSFKPKDGSKKEPPDDDPGSPANEEKNARVGWPDEQTRRISHESKEAKAR